MEEAVAAAAAASAAFFALLASSALCCASSSRSLCDGSDSTLLPPLVKVRVWGLKKVAGLAWDLFFSSLGFSGSIFGARGRKRGGLSLSLGFSFCFPCSLSGVFLFLSVSHRPGPPAWQVGIEDVVVGERRGHFLFRCFWFSDWRKKDEEVEPKKSERKTFKPTISLQTFRKPKNSKRQCPRPSPPRASARSLRSSPREAAQQ